MSDNLKTISTHRDSISVGSVVELKSGGPPMTVKARMPDEAYVVWHNADGDLFKDVIPLCCLKLVRG